MTQPWRDHPKLKGRFPPEAPDDVQVIVHDGGPRLTNRAPESIWVTVSGGDSNDVFTGRILNQPEQLSSVTQGAEIKFVAPSGDSLLMVTDKYLSERSAWVIHPCDKCGLDELFDAPSDLVPVIFPDAPAGAMPEMFTSFCGMCGGVQVVQDADSDIPNATAPSGKKAWWQFWR